MGFIEEGRSVLPTLAVKARYVSRPGSPEAARGTDKCFAEATIAEIEHSPRGYDSKLRTFMIDPRAEDARKMRWRN